MNDERGIKMAINIATVALIIIQQANILYLFKTGTRAFDKEAGKYLNKSGNSIADCASGRQKTAYGFKWKYE